MSFNICGGRLFISTRYRIFFLLGTSRQVSDGWSIPGVLLNAESPRFVLSTTLLYAGLSDACLFPFEAGSNCWIRPSSNERIYIRSCKIGLFVNACPYPSSFSTTRADIVPLINSQSRYLITMCRRDAVPTI